MLKQSCKNAKTIESKGTNGKSQIWYCNHNLDICHQVIILFSCLSCFVAVIKLQRTRPAFCSLLHSTDDL